MEKGSGWICSLPRRPARAKRFLIPMSRRKERQHPFVASPALAAALMEIGIEEHYGERDLLFQQGTPSKGVFLVVAGAVELYMPEPAGLKRLLRHAGPNSLLGVPATVLEREYSLTATALEPTEVRLISSAKFKDHLVQRPEIYYQVLSVLADELRELRYTIAARHRRPGSLSDGAL